MKRSGVDSEICAGDSGRPQTGRMRAVRAGSSRRSGASGLRRCCAMLVFAAVWAATALTAAGCDRVFEYHPYDVRITGACDINAGNAARIETITAGRTSFRFAVISDTQRRYDETEDAVRALNGRRDLDFVVHCGDLSDFGVGREFMWQRDMLQKLNVPYVCVLGNHDCLGSGEQAYRRIFGPYDYAFTAGDVRFVCLNTNAGEYDYVADVPDFGFLSGELAAVPSEARRTVFVMHVPPYDPIFNNNVAAFFEEQLLAFPEPIFAVFGHQHRMRVFEPFDDGLLYYGCTDIADRQYLVFTVDETGYACETVAF